MSCCCCVVVVGFVVVSVVFVVFVSVFGKGSLGTFFRALFCPVLPCPLLAWFVVADAAAAFSVVVLVLVVLVVMVVLVVLVVLVVVVGRSWCISVRHRHF